jgi:hypothetical protein
MKIPRKKMTLSRLESTFWGVSSFISLDFDDANEFCETVVRVYKKDKINRNPDFHASSLHPPVEYVLKKKIKERKLALVLLAAS